MDPALAVPNPFWDSHRTCRTTRRGEGVAGRPLHTFQVISTEWLAPHLVRLMLGGKGFDTFTPDRFSDSYVKFVFFPSDVDVTALPPPLTMDSFVDLPAGSQPRVRTFTVRRADTARREIAVDFVVHGEQGVAGPWVRTARPGTTAYLMGPSGAYSPDPAADWYLFAGDETGIPAIGAALERLPSDAIGKVIIEIAGPADEVALSAPDGVTIAWIHRGGRADLVADGLAGDNAPLIEAVTAADWLPGRAQVFIHGEAQAVMHNLRPYIRKVRGVEAQWASISGYWRRGRTEETFRQWKKDLAAAEAAGNSH